MSNSKVFPPISFFDTYPCRLPHFLKFLFPQILNVWDPHPHPTTLTILVIIPRPMHPAPTLQLLSCEYTSVNKTGSWTSQSSGTETSWPISSKKRQKQSTNGELGSKGSANSKCKGMIEIASDISDTG